MCDNVSQTMYLDVKEIYYHSGSISMQSDQTGQENKPDSPVWDGVSREKPEAQGQEISYSNHPTSMPRVGCGSTCRNEDVSSKRYYPRKIERINFNALKEEELRGSRLHFQVWGNVNGLTSNCAVRILCHQEGKHQACWVQG